MGAPEFWADRDVWAAGHRGRSGEGVAENHAPGWDVVPSVPARAVGAHQGTAEVTVGPGLEEGMVHLLAGMPRELGIEMEAHLTAVMRNAFRQWPVSTGYSKGKLFLSFEPAGETFTCRMGSAAPYVAGIRSNPGQRLIDIPGAAATEAAIQAAFTTMGREKA